MLNSTLQFEVVATVEGDLFMGVFVSPHFQVSFIQEDGINSGIYS